MINFQAGQMPVRTLAVGALTSALLVGLIQTGLHLPISHPAPARADSGQQIRQEMGTFARLAKDLKPSVVNIAVEKVVTEQQPDLSRLFPGFPGFFSDTPLEQPRQQPYKRRSQGQGSGVVISTDGFIITNNHVVAGVKSCRVTLADGNELEGKVVGTDPKTDLALIKVVSSKPLPAAQLGDSEALQVGDWVMAIGNPFGLEATVTVGVLSGKGRVIGAGMYDDFLQTDASINPGNSGGPLFNTAGQVVGINTAIIPNAQGIGFSIPVNMVKDIVAQLKDKGRVTRGFLGVGVQPMTKKLKESLKIPQDLKGALISSLIDGGPASKAGIRVQDVVISINGKPISSDRDLLADVARTPVGQPADLEIWRNGKTQHLKITVVERPDDQQVSQSQDLPVDDAKAMGISIRQLTPEMAQQLSSHSSDGVVIMGVMANSPAARAGLQRGDIIHQINNTGITTPDQFIKALRSQQRDSFALLIERQGSTLFLTVES